MLQVLIKASALFVQIVILVTLARQILRGFFSYFLPRSVESGAPGGKLPSNGCWDSHFPIYDRKRRRWFRQTGPFSNSFGIGDDILERLLGTDFSEFPTDESTTSTEHTGVLDLEGPEDTSMEVLDANHVLPEDASDSPINYEILSKQISNFLRTIITQMENVQKSVPLGITDECILLAENEQPTDCIELEYIEQLLKRTKSSPVVADGGGYITSLHTPEGSPLPTIEEGDDEVKNVEAACDEQTHTQKYCRQQNVAESFQLAEESNTSTVGNASQPFARAAESTDSVLQFGDLTFSEVDGSNEQLEQNVSEPNLTEISETAVDSRIMTALNDQPSLQQSYGETISLIIKNIETTLSGAPDLESLECKESERSFDSPAPDTRHQSSSSITFKEISQKYTYMPQLVAAELGMKESYRDWDVFWIQDFVSFRTCRKMKTYQRINHFPGSICLSNKDLLGRNLNAMCDFFPKDYNIFPKTWLVPRDTAKIERYARENLGASFIVKPHDSSCGSGIRITRRVREIGSHGKIVCQLYIQRPFLIDGYKFDFRVYVLLTSIQPLRVFVHREGLARFATVKYEKPSVDNSRRKCMHLTNTHINKTHPSYIREENSGSTRRLTAVFKWFEDNQIDVQKVQNSMDDTIIKTIITGLPTLQHYYHMSFPCHTTSISCFELMGFDIMLDNKLKVYLLEVNVCPSFANETGTTHVACIKREVVSDTFKILNLMENERNLVTEEKENHPKSRREMHKVANKKKNLKGRQKAKTTEKMQKDGKSKRVNKVKDSTITNRRVDWENAHMGNFRKIYPPVLEGSYYQKFIDKAFSKLKPNQYLHMNGNELTDEQKKWLT